MAVQKQPRIAVLLPCYNEQATIGATVEGFRHRELPVFSVQYHPEASPGPHDATYLFDAFIEMMKTRKAPTGKRLAELQALRG